jgi:hypothetical protein
MVSGLVWSMTRCQTVSGTATQSTVGVCSTGVDKEVDGRRWAVKELGKDGFEVFNRFLYHISEAARTMIRFEI